MCETYVAIFLAPVELLFFFVFGATSPTGPRSTHSQVF